MTDAFARLLDAAEFDSPRRVLLRPGRLNCRSGRETGEQDLNIVSKSSPTGTQFLQAVGSAEATMRAKLVGITESFKADEVVLCTAGEGTTSEGEFFVEWVSGL